MRVATLILVVLGLAATGCTNDYGSLRFVDESELAAGAAGTAGASSPSNGGQPATGSGGTPATGGAAVGAGGA